MAAPAMRCLIRPFECSGELSVSVYSYTRIYAAQIVLVTLLSAVTIYRREMSCNRVYQDDDDDDDDDGDGSNATTGGNRTSTNRTTTSMSHHRRQQEDTKEGAEWDDLLEGAGKWGSGKPLTGIILSIWSHLIQCKQRIERGSNNNATTCYWTEEMSDELLEGAGLSLSGEPFWSTVLALWAHIWATSIEEHRNREFTIIASSNNNNKEQQSSPFLTQRLSPDVQVQILSFLTPRDITTFACCNKDCKELIDNPNSDTCLHLWKTLWDRDYAWLVQSWDVGVAAHRRSSGQQQQETVVDKRLYFEFGQTYMNYLLAGHNTMQSCLVGLHGNIYNITDFLEEHPGSPETLLVHAGQDATQLFEDIGHSSRARRLTQALCVTTDRSFSKSGGCGIVRSDAATTGSVVPSDRRRRPRRPATLMVLQQRLQKEERTARRAYERRIPNNVLGEIVMYYDAFDRKWKAWYTDDGSHQTWFI